MPIIMGINKFGLSGSNDDNNNNSTTTWCKVMTVSWIVAATSLLAGCSALQNWNQQQDSATAIDAATVAAADIVKASDTPSQPLPPGTPQRGLLIETPQGPVPAQFAARSVAVNASRCARLNNYWCIKTPTNGDQWEGQIGEDSSGHAYFSDPVYSARAFARTIRSYYFRRDIKSVSGIINRYAPTSDCIGSLSYCPTNGATVRQHSPINATGRIGNQYVFYTDQKPSGSHFTRSTGCQQMLMYCPRGRNQSEEYAADVAKTMKTNPASDLGMFDSLGRVHYSQMLTLMKAMAKWEMGHQYAVDEALMREGLIMEVRDFRATDPSKWPGVLPRAFAM